jgi:hypothetical protein
MNAIESITLWYANDSGMYARASELAEQSDTLEECAEAFKNDVDSMLESGLSSQSGFIADIVNNAIARITWQEWLDFASIYMEEAGKLSTEEEEEQEEMNEGD